MATAPCLLAAKVAPWNPWTCTSAVISTASPREVGALSRMVSPSRAAGACSPSRRFRAMRIISCAWRLPNSPGRRQHGAGRPLDVHVVGRLDLAPVNAERLMVEVEHRHPMTGERVPEFVLASRRNLEGENCCLGELAGREASVHLLREIG